MMAHKYSEQEKAYMRELYLKHREEKKAHARTYYHNNREKIRATQKQYYLKNRDKMMKRFRENYYKDHEEHKRQQREYGAQHRAQRNAYVSALYKKRVKWFEELKASVSCSMCGQSFPDCPSVIDFHHTGDESKRRGGVQGMVSQCKPEKLILAEIAKCIPLCANCHRKLHYSARRKGKGV
jgi:hypothetical protein